MDEETQGEVDGLRSGRRAVGPRRDKVIFLLQAEPRCAILSFVTERSRARVPGLAGQYGHQVDGNRTADHALQSIGEDAEGNPEKAG